MTDRYVVLEGYLIGQAYEMIDKELGLKKK